MDSLLLCPSCEGDVTVLVDEELSDTPDTNSFSQECPDCGEELFFERDGDKWKVEVNF